MKLLLVLLAFAIAASGQQTSFAELARLFENDPHRPGGEKAVPIKGRPGVRLYDYSFASPVEGRVPGVLVTPDRAGRFPVILFGHWMMDGSPLRNRNEFLEEAIVLARAGAICLLVDTPQVRRGEGEDPDYMKGQGPKAQLQMAREWRRALDLLLVRKDADPAHVAYVGHSFNAGVGAKLAAVEKRIQSFVLMANVYSLRDLLFDEQNPEIYPWTQREGKAKLESYFAKFPWDDSAEFVKHSAPAAVFVQNGRGDKPMPERIVKKSFAYIQEPKRLAFYDAGHELNAPARMDRVKWLTERLGLKNVDFGSLSAIPPLK